MAKVYPNGGTAVINVKTYGAYGDGAHDDTAAIQSAINAAIASGTRAPLYFPAGTHNISSELTVGSSSSGTDAPVIILGDGRFVSQIQLTSASINGFHIYSYSPVTIKDLRMLSSQSGGQTGGSMILLDAPASGANSSSRFQDLWFEKSYIGITIKSASGYVVDGCMFYLPNNAGMVVGNSSNSDSGDATIVHCNFYNPGSTTSTGIYYNPAGGLRIVDNKFNGLNWGIVLSLPSGVGTSVFVVSGNSIEGYANSGIILTQAVSGSGSFVSVAISGNEISSGNGNGITVYGPSSA